MSSTEPGLLYVSTGCMSNGPLAMFLEECADRNIRNIELSSGVPYEAGIIQTIEKNRRQFKYLIHNYFPPPLDPFVLNLAAADETCLIRSQELCRRAIDLCAEFGAPFYSVHAGFRAAIKPESLGKFLKYDEIIPYDRAFATFVDSIKSLVAYARRQKIELLIEPNVVAECNMINGRNELMLICEADEVIKLADCVNDPGFGILLDTGHLNVSSKTLGFSRERFVEKTAPYVKAYHIHDNDGYADTHQPVKPDSWIFGVLPKPIFRKLPVIIEAKFGNIDDLEKHIEWLKGYLRNDCSNG